MIRARDLLLHPIAIAAIAILVANDHWWKLSHPGWWTGKASDVAGMAFFPLLVLVVVERAVAHRALALAIAAGATAIAFALVKTVPAASAVFGHALGLLQWPGAAVAAWWHGNAITGPIAASVVTDPTDLLAIPFVAVAVIVARRCGYLAEPTRRSRRAGSRHGLPALRGSIGAHPAEEVLEARQERVCADVDPTDAR